MRKIAIFIVGMGISVMAENPVVQTCYTTDPAPMVHDGTFYIYTGRDEAGADFFWMHEWRVYSSRDMVNWTDHGAPLSIAGFGWADDRAWAPQCVERDGRFYLYVPVHSRLSGGMAIGVAVADSPVGPFRDALGKPLFDNGSWDNIDPTVFVDYDGQAYIYWGNPEIYCARLGRDMISIDGEVKKIEQTVEGFGAPGPQVRDKDVKYRDNYTEGPWFTRRGDHYYLLYAAGGVPEHIAYSMSDNPFGPWTYMGEIMPEGGTGSFTNHCAVMDFNGRSYFAYHTGRLPGGGGFGRSVALEEFTYNPDGTIPVIHPTDEGVEPVAVLDPYRRVEAETMAWSSGVSTEPNAVTGVYVSDIHNGDFIKIANVDFADRNPSVFSASVASARQGGDIEVHLDAVDGPSVAVLKVPSTGGWEAWQTLETSLTSRLSGIHDLYLVFKGQKGPKLMTFDYWTFR